MFVLWGFDPSKDHLNTTLYVLLEEIDERI